MYMLPWADSLKGHAIYRIKPIYVLYCRFNNARADIANNFASGRHFDDYWAPEKEGKSTRVKFSLGPGDSAAGG